MDCGVFTIPLIQTQEPGTPQITRALEDASQLSSPIENYAIACAKPPKSPTTVVHVQHKASDRTRLTVRSVLYPILANGP